MTWADVTVPDATGLRVVQCTACGRKARSRFSHSRIFCVCSGRGKAAVLRRPRWHEWGHWLALFLGELGVTKRRYVAVKAWLGLVPTCGCQRREEAMNRWGDRLRVLVGRLVRR